MQALSVNELAVWCHGCNKYIDTHMQELQPFIEFYEALKFQQKVVRMRSSSRECWHEVLTRYLPILCAGAYTDRSNAGHMSPWRPCAFVVRCSALQHFLVRRADMFAGFL